MRSNKITQQKILIVEDDEASRILIKEILEYSNVVVLESGCREDALNFFKMYRDEPDCDGCELLKHFRRENPSIPVIAISALKPEELAAKCKSAGFNAYISKPFDIDEFIRIVSSYL